MYLFFILYRFFFFLLLLLILLLCLLILPYSSSSFFLLLLLLSSSCEERRALGVEGSSGTSTVSQLILMSQQHDIIATGTPFSFRNPSLICVPVSVVTGACRLCGLLLVVIYRRGVESDSMVRLLVTAPSSWDDGVTEVTHGHIGSR